MTTAEAVRIEASTGSPRPSTGADHPRSRAAPGGRRTLLSLMLTAMIPVLLFGGAVSYLTAEQARHAAREDAVHTLDRVASRVTSEFEKEIEVAQTLAALPSLEAKDLSSFYKAAARIVNARALWETVSLADASGKMLLNLLRPYGDTLGPVADRQAFDTVVRTDRPAIGNIGEPGPSTGKRLVALGVPVHLKGKVEYVLTVGLSPSAIQGVLLAAGAPKGWTGTIVDGSGMVVARTARTEDVGSPVSEAVRKATRGGKGGFYTEPVSGGDDVEVVFRRLPLAGDWTVHFGIPKDSLNKPVLRSVQLLAAGSLASLLLAAGVAHLTSRDLAQRRDQEQERIGLALALSQEREALAVQAAELGTWRWDAEADEVSGSDRAGELMAISPSLRRHGSRLPLQLCLSHVHAADRSRVEDAVRDSVNRGVSLDVEFRVVSDEGDVRWVRAKGRALSQSGSPPEEAHLMHGVVADIEPQKRAQAERLDLLRRLADSQEDEQRRIARELHDQVGQTVTGLSLGLKTLEASLEPGHGAADQVRWLQTLAGDIGRDIHRAASDLRPTALDDLGLEGALGAFARDWGERCNVAVDLQCVGVEERLPSEVETAIYRVVQEALTNILKHADAQSASIVIERRGGRVRAIIEDDGVGFDAVAADRPSNSASAVGRAHLGLKGIRERLALLGGALTVESAPGAGTTLFIEIPLRAGEVA